MDPLSIAASIAGLLTITGAIVSRGYAQISQAKKQDTDFAALLNEVASFSGILLGLQSQFNAIGESEDSPFPWFAQGSADTWQETLKTCEQTLTEIKEILESRASSKTVRLMVKGVAMTARIEKLVVQVERFKSLFILCLQLQNNADTRTTTRLTLEVVDILHGIADKQEVMARKADAKEQAELRNKIVDWLGPTSEAMHDDIVRSRDPQSCQWLLERDEFLNWLGSDGFASFWLWGIQGSGKTVIVSKIIEVIESSFLEEGDVMVYHYCRFSDSAASSSARVLGAIAAQLLSRLPESVPVPAILSKLLNRYRSRSYPGLTELREAFHELCQHCRRVFVIIDGLDEVSERAGVLQFLTDLEVVGGVFKVFVASRPEVDLETNFESYLTVPITQSDLQLDMETHVRQQLENLQIGDDEEATQDLIVSELVERAQGMFLWAVCQLDHLSRIRTAITADVLTALPRGLENTFAEILLKLEDEDQSLALNILRVIMFSERALDITELIEAVAMTPNARIRNLRQLRNNSLRRPNDVFQLCGSLIRQSHTTGKISLSHYSVKEFLSLPVLGKSRPNPFYLEGKASQISQFRTCIQYLSLEDFASETFRETLRLAQDPLYSDSDLQVITNFPFLDYASSYWAQHLKYLDEKDFQAIWLLLRGFLDSKEGSFDTWILISQYTHGDYKYPLGSKAVHVAALYGLEVLLAGLLRADPASRTKQTSDGRAPLHIALENEQEVVVDLLLDSTEKIDPLVAESLSVRDQRGRTPLHTAIESGNELAVVKLVTVGADVNAVQSDGSTPISVAVENRWDLLAEFLSQMADSSKTLADGRSLLHIAAQSGSLVWATALLKFHEDQLVDARDENDWTALHYAVDREHAHIARKLLDSDCLIEAYDKNGWTPLHAAIRRQNLECASLLLNRVWPGGKPRTVPPTSSSRATPPDNPTSRASRLLPSRESRRPVPSSSLSGKYAHEPRRDRPQRPDDEEPFSLDVFPLSRRRKPSPLHLAVQESYTDGVRLLAQHQDKLFMLGLDKNETSDCLAVALESGNTDIILVLIQMVSKPDLGKELPRLLALSSDPINEILKEIITTEEIYATHLPHIIPSDMESIVPSMLLLWPEANDAAIITGIKKCPKLAKMLIGNGIPSSRILLEESQEPLLHRALRGVSVDLDFARYLVEQGANVNVKDGVGDTPLLALAESSFAALLQKHQQLSFEAAEYLVSQGADIHALDPRSRGLCHKAASAGNNKILEWALRTLNLNPCSRDKNSRTPLLLAVEGGRIGTVQLLIKHLISNEGGDESATHERVIDAMEYANMRSAPLLRAMIDRSERNIVIVTTLVEADEEAFRKLNSHRQSDVSGLRTAFYIEALTWAIDCNFADAFNFLLPKISKAALRSRTNLDGDSVFHAAAAADGNEYLKTLLQTLISEEDGDGKALYATNIAKEAPMDIVIGRGDGKKFNLLVLHGVVPTLAQISKAKEKGIEVSEELEAQARARSTV
ncbi:ankyrin [Lentithecium fluviatile CBS 122367]|uniref:Ankyrin n=1 Tax=Lentithecium fluviatile CBS 122367 TaxID=1168545 RepID=A0A6G1IVA2_9PLEO|nr:ankyrin [Lentithecium fluviatile CBS 122367]